MHSPFQNSSKVQRDLINLGFSVDICLYCKEIVHLYSCLLALMEGGRWLEVCTDGFLTRFLPNLPTSVLDFLFPCQYALSNMSTSYLRIGF